MSLGVEPISAKRFTAVIQPFTQFGPQQEPSAENFTSMATPFAVQIYRGGFSQNVAALSVEKSSEDKITTPWLSDSTLTCTFDFIDRPTYLHTGQKFFLRRHNFRALGEVVELHDVEEQRREDEAMGKTIKFLPGLGPEDFGTSPPVDDGDVTSLFS